MQLPKLFVEKKTIIIEMVVLVMFLCGMYYVYTLFSVDEEVTTQVKINEQLLGQNLTLFLKALNQDRISFDTSSFITNPLIGELQDFSETILPASTRGRSDPFMPYAFTRPLR